MPQPSPTIEGFRAVFRRPAFALAEITWRWTFGGAACLLLLFSFLEYLDTLTVTTGDMLFLRSRQPFLVSEAITHILSGSGKRLVEAMLVLAPALALLWILAASLGRVATLKPLLDHFRPSESAAPTPLRLRFWRGAEENWRLRSLVGLNFLRVGLALAAVLGIFAAAIIAGFASSDKDPQPGLVFLIFTPLALLVALAWSAVNWYLSLAPIFVVHDGRDAFGSVSAAVEFCRQRTGAVVWSSTAFGLLHLVAFVVATVVAFFPLAFVSVIPGRVVIAALVLLTLVYFAVVDFLYMGRLAAYVHILETPEEAVDTSIQQSAVSIQPAESLQPPITVAQPELPPPPPTAPSEDDILSDVPGLVLPPEESRD